MLSQAQTASLPRIRTVCLPEHGVAMEDIGTHPNSAPSAIDTMLTTGSPMLLFGNSGGDSLLQTQSMQAMLRDFLPALASQVRSTAYLTAEQC